MSGRVMQAVRFMNSGSEVQARVRSPFADATPRYSAIHSTVSGGDRSKFQVGMGENSVCGMGSVLIMLVVVGCILFLPLVIGSVQPPSGLMLLIFPVTLAAVFFLLSRASSN
ncbi:hypothetical protein SDJN02_26213, partial [Cucurbita argyrosperma subsp. argyrosperma]